MTVTYARTLTEGQKAVRDVRHVIVKPGRVAVVKYRNGVSRAGYHEDIRTRFPALTAWRVGRALRRDGYTRQAAA
jgi:hypothetical protein